MDNIIEIISDLNVTIADTETTLAQLSNSNVKDTPALTFEQEMKRAIGQMKAARASLIFAQKAMKEVA
jgi:hypothetical protein